MLGRFAHTYLVGLGRVFASLLGLQSVRYHAIPGVLKKLSHGTQEVTRITARSTGWRSLNNLVP